MSEYGMRCPSLSSGGLSARRGQWREFLCMGSIREITLSGAEAVMPVVAASRSMGWPGLGGAAGTPQALVVLGFCGVENSAECAAPAGDPAALTPDSTLPFCARREGHQLGSRI